MSLKRVLGIGLAIGVAIHLDWHLARPMDQRLSMGWSQHWLLAIPIFLGVAWYMTRRWSKWRFAPVLLSVGLGVLLGQVIEPLGEVVLYGDTLADAYEPARVRAFLEFCGAGLLTLFVALPAFWLRARQGA